MEQVPGDIGGRVSRGGLLGGAVAALVGGLLARGASARADGPSPFDVLPVEVAPGLAIRPRDAWGADLPPRGPIQREIPQFLLVHHTASSSAYPDARGLIRSAFAFHTSTAKGWPDVCYEFFVGRDGDVWEGRAGALTHPVVADASGGSQGFAQLVCLLGDFTAAPPTDAAFEALVLVLAWLSRRDGISVAPGATTSFVSRGSDRWAAGTPVTTPTIAGHRDMTYTSCPGDAMYALMPQLRARADARRREWDAAMVAHASPDGLLPARRLGVVDSP